MNGRTFLASEENATTTTTQPLSYYRAKQYESVKKNPNGPYIYPLIPSIPQSGGSLGHHRWFRNQFSPFVPVLHCPLGLCEHQACPFPDVVFPPLPLSALSSSPFHCVLQDGFGQTWWTGDMTITGYSLPKTHHAMTTHRVHKIHQKYILKMLLRQNVCAEYNFVFNFFSLYVPSFPP